MEERPHLWWQKARKPLEVFGIIIVCMLVMGLLVVIILAYVFNVNVPGLRGKTLWDWLQLLIIPVVLAVGGYLFNYTTTRAEQRNTQVRDQNEQSIASDNQREAALQAYIDNMSELLLHEKLRESGEDDEVRKIARVRTLTVLPRLDTNRKGSVLQFLHESSLIHKDKKNIDLRGANLISAFLYGAHLNGAELGGANLRGADLSQARLIHVNLDDADLRGADLTGAELGGANLSGASLSQADLSGANLSYADLSGAFLGRADLSGADLSYAKVTEEQLKEAKSLKEAIMPDGLKHS